MSIDEDFEAWWKEYHVLYKERDRALIYRGYVNGRNYVAPTSRTNNPPIIQVRIHVRVTIIEGVWTESAEEEIAETKNHMHLAATGKASFGLQTSTGYLILSRGVLKKAVFEIREENQDENS